MTSTQSSGLLRKMYESDLKVNAKLVLTYLILNGAMERFVDMDDADLMIPMGLSQDEHK
jgi:hypothetical protein